MPWCTGSTVDAIRYLRIWRRLESRILDDLGWSIEGTGIFGDDASASTRYTGGSAGAWDVGRNPSGRSHRRRGVRGAEGACG